MKRLMILGFAVILTALTAPAQDWARARIDKSPRHLEWVKVKHGDRAVNCFIAYPEVKDKATAVVVIHEIFGLSDWVRDQGRCGIDPGGEVHIHPLCIRGKPDHGPALRARGFHKTPEPGHQHGAIRQRCGRDRLRLTLNVASTTRFVRSSATTARCCSRAS